MKEFKLIHVCVELGARVCVFNEETLLLDKTSIPEEILAAQKLEIGEKMLYHFGHQPVKTGTLFRIR
jgi:hypothetical protein